MVAIYSLGMFFFFFFCFLLLFFFFCCFFFFFFLFLFFCFFFVIATLTGIFGVCQNSLVFCFGLKSRMEVK